MSEEFILKNKWQAEGYEKGKAFIQGFTDTFNEKDAEIARLKDIIKRLLSYALDEYDMKTEDLEREGAQELFTRGFWTCLKEAVEATKEK